MIGRTRKDCEAMNWRCPGRTARHELLAMEVYINAFPPARRVKRDWFAEAKARRRSECKAPGRP